LRKHKKKVAGGLPFVLENADKGLHTKTGEDDGNPADGSENNGFSTGFIATRLVLRPIALMAMIMRNLESCLRGVKKLLDTPREVRRVVRRDARIK